MVSQIAALIYKLSKTKRNLGIFLKIIITKLLETILGMKWHQNQVENMFH